MEYIITHTVTSEDLAVNVKSGSLEVLATPRLAALFEEASMRLAEQNFDEAVTVGSELSIRHNAPTAIGGVINVRSTLLKSEGRRLEFALFAEDECGVIAEGEHIRYIVDPDRFMKKAKSRSMNC